MPEYNGATPEKDGNAEFTYTFAGWDNAIAPVTGDTVYTAKFNENTNTYTVIWKNHNGDTLETDNNVPYGATPEYNGATPEKDGNAEFTYTFAGWDNAIAPVTGDTVYTASFGFSVNEYNVTFISNGGSAVAAQTVKYGDKAAAPADPARNGYTFAGWYTEMTFVNKYNFETVVTGDITVYAAWNKVNSYAPSGFVPTGKDIIDNLILTFETNGGTEIKSMKCRQDTIVRLAGKVTVREGYDFDGWYSDRELTNRITQVQVEESTTVYASWKKSANTTDGVYKWLDTSHSAYIFGYPDGTIRPEALITRAEVTAMFYRLLNEKTRNELTDASSSFADVDASAWSFEYVRALHTLGMINGRGNNMFYPDEYITRAEFAVICTRFDDSAYEGTAVFSDIADHWAKNEINEAAARGWILGFGDGTFRPDENITRAQAMTIINRMLDRTPESENCLHYGMTSWKDNPSDAWYYISVQEATNTHDYKMIDGKDEKWVSVENKE
ncbi:MAG: S-layer homology domain-containing protein, partial [Clostridia bacterium]|nr:S-layer homology domain-containing protein [Clostridia bacterium]